MVHRNWNLRAFLLIYTVLEKNNNKMAKLFVQAPQTQESCGS